MTADTIQQKLAELRGDAATILAPRTRKTYRSHWTDFARWCADHGHQALPATSVTVVGYLLARFEAGKAMATIKTARQAIASKHNLAGLDRPTDSQDVRDTLRLLGRKASRQGRGVQKQAPGIRLEHIREYEAAGKPSKTETWGNAGAAWTETDERNYRLTLAMLYTMHNALLRRSEASRLEWRDVTFLENGQARLTVRRSKTSDQPMTRLLTRKAVECLRAVRPNGKDPDGRVFGATSGRTIQDRIQRAMSGIRPGCTGHSLRVGGAQDLTIRGASLQQVKEAGGWKSLTMPAHYAKAVRPEVGGVTLLEDK